ncbi:MAG: hypothetical protein NC320_03195 [Clostridium sp.]|nr:hypothetical protein [Clostridium sp.]
MKIQSSKRVIKSRNRRVMAETDVAEEASDLLFEVDDVAELLADATGEDVDVTADGEVVKFDVGDETYTCSAEPGDEVVESKTRISRGKRRVSASSTIRRPAGRTVRRVSRRR